MSETVQGWHIGPAVAVYKVKVDANGDMFRLTFGDDYEFRAAVVMPASLAVELVEQVMTALKQSGSLTEAGKRRLGLLERVVRYDDTRQS
jgi:hypothetical protein